MVHFTLKNFLAGAALTLSCAAFAATDAPSFDWADYLQTAETTGTYVTNVAADGNGASYWMGCATTNDNAVNLNGEALFTGETKVGTAATNNFVLFKAGADGAPVWNIHSTAGDYGSGKMGGVTFAGDKLYFFVGVRQYNANVKSNLIDAKGTKHEFGEVVENVADRYHIGILVCATLDGEISWIKTLTAPEGQKDALTPQGISVASDGTIVLTMAASQPITMGTATITPAADTNQAIVVVADNEGEYVSHFAPTGTTLGTSAFTGLSCDGSNFFFAGTVTPASDPITVTFGDQEITTGTKISGFVAKATLASVKTGKFDWATSLPGTLADGQTSFAMQFIRLTPGVDCYWVSGALKGAITAGDITITTTQFNQNEGLLIKLDNSGEIVDWAVSHADFTPGAISGYTGVMQGDAANVYVVGYAMANFGVYIREYDALTLDPVADKAWSLYSSAAMLSVAPFAYDSSEGAIYVATRSNKVVNILGGEQSPESTSWVSVCSKFTLPEDLKTGIENVAVEAQGVSVKAVEGGVEVAADYATTVAVYDVVGRCVATVAVAADAPATVALPAGVYVAAGVKVAVR